MADFDIPPDSGNTPATGGGTGKAGDAKKDEEKIEDHFDPVTPAPSHDRLAQKGSQQKVWVTYRVQDPKETRFTRDIIKESDPKKKPAAGTFWSYEVKYTELDGVEGVSCKEEAEQVQEQIEKLPVYKRKNKGEPDPSQKVYYYKDENGDNTPDLHEESISGIDATAKNGPSAPSEVGNENGNGLLQFEGSVRSNLNKLKDKEKQIQFLIMLLAAALASGAGIGILRTIASLFAGLAQARSGEIGVIVGDAMSKIGLQNSEISEEIADILQKGDKLGPEDHGKIEKLRNLLRTNQNLMEGPLQNQLRDSVHDAQGAAEWAESIAPTIARILNSPMRWN